MHRFAKCAALAAAMFCGAGAIVTAQESRAVPNDAARLAALLRLEDLRVRDPAAWAPLQDAADATWTLRVDLARRRVFEDPFAAPAPPSDAAAAEKIAAALRAAGDDAVAARRAAHDAARFGGKLPASLAPALLARLRDPDAETAGFAARALAKVEGSAETEATAIATAYLEDERRVPRLDRLRALATLPGGPARIAILDAVKSDDPHRRRTGFETAEAVAASLGERDRKGLASLAIIATDVDPVADVRAAAAGAAAALDEDRFFARLGTYRFVEPWNVRAVVADRLAVSSLARLGGPDAPFVHDPDRRVRQALLEAAARSVGSRQGSARHDLLSPAFRTATAALLGGSGETSTALPRRGDDPVEVGLRAALWAALAEEKAVPVQEATAFLEAALVALPAHEIEPRQAVIDLAAALEAKDRLLGLAASETEPALRARAAAAARKFGLSPPTDGAVVSVFDEADYLAAARRALATRRPLVRVKTDRGELTLELRPDLAPLTVHHFLRLVRNGFYDGILFHRVVPGFVAQAGCPRGDGYGGPGYAIRCETSDAPYARGTLGMALAGKDTGGSQWFLTHRATPHLEGKYTVFGRLAAGDDVLDALVPGDRILAMAVEE